MPPLLQINDNEELTRAFNKGSDARIAGLEVTDNPFSKGARTFSGSLQIEWRRGYLHAHKYWGVDVKGQWAIIALPKTKGRHHWRDQEFSTNGYHEDDVA